MKKKIRSFVDSKAAYIFSKSPALRRMAWRTGRSVYCLARGEQRIDDMRVDGELHLQRCVMNAKRADPRFVAFDVGANQGDWSLALLEHAASMNNTDWAEVHVFEPIPTTRARLISRLDASGLKGARVNGVAASDKTGTFEMAVMSETGGINTLVYDNTTARQAIGFVPVPLTTLDKYCSENSVDRINILKCDTEGHDLAVMRGGIDLLRSERVDIWQFEYNQRWIAAHAFLKDVFDFIDDLPYRIGRVMPSSLEMFESWHPELERFYQSNYVLIHESVLPWLPVTEGTFDASNSYA